MGWRGGKWTLGKHRWKWVVSYHYSMILRTLTLWTMLELLLTCFSIYLFTTTPIIIIIIFGVIKNVIVICFISFIYYSYGIRMYFSFSWRLLLLYCIRTFLIGYHHTFIVCDVNRQRNYRVCKWWVQWQWKVIINNTIHYYQSSHQLDDDIGVCWFSSSPSYHSSHHTHHP